MGRRKKAREDHDCEAAELRERQRELTEQLDPADQLYVLSRTADDKAILSAVKGRLEAILLALEEEKRYR